MSLPKVIDDVIRYVSGAVSRIFALNDNHYPDSGVQPYSGEPYDEKREKHHSNW